MVSKLGDIMRMKFVISGEYDLTDDILERLRIYGTADPKECADIDSENDPIEFLNIIDVSPVDFRIEPAD